MISIKLKSFYCLNLKIIYLYFVCIIFQGGVFTINKLSSRIDYIQMPCFWRILYCLENILQLWRFYLLVLGNIHFHFTLAVLKQQFNYPVITFCFINFITKFSSTMDTITPCNTTSIYQGSPVSTYKMCDNNNQACLFSVFKLFNNFKDNICKKW